MAYKQKNNPFVKASPNKFLGKALKGLAGGLGKVALGGIGNLLGGKKIFGGNRRGGGLNPNALLGGMGQVFGGGNNSGNADATQAALNAQQSVPLTKKKKYKKKK
tara:strand:- start:423 stop:737 length:315 start_codon:yes stop_codon:yes gene_type:complete